ncbi:hypothetical protein Leryth_027261 [Lithospermum erythrorhizon]|nr:hypothetical protein Leryth_027261 [Lithospermum erythrorhizon]
MYQTIDISLDSQKVSTNKSRYHEQGYMDRLFDGIPFQNIKNNEIEKKNDFDLLTSKRVEILICFKFSGKVWIEIPIYICPVSNKIFNLVNLSYFSRRKQRSVEFQVFGFTNKIRNLLLIYIYTKRTIYLRGVYGRILRENVNDYWLICQKNRVRYKNNSWKNESIKTYDCASYKKDLMIVNMGPQHPSMHGVLRLLLL